MPFSRTSTRTLRAIAYAVFALAGAVLATQLEAIPGIVVELWLVMTLWLLLGGVLALVGQLRRRWTGEFVGLPLLFSALFGFGILQANLTGWNLSVVPSVALLWGFSASLAARWVDVQTLYRASRTGGPR